MDNNEEFKILLLFLTGIGVAIGIFVLTIFVVFQRKRQRHLQQVAELQQEMLRSQIEIQEQTLLHVSQELHDNIGQRLGLTKIQLAALSSSVQNESLQSIREQIAQSIADIRQISKSLHPERVARQGFIPSVENAFFTINQTPGWQATLQIDGKPEMEKSETQVILFRMIQELVNNAMKHSGGNHLELLLHFHEKGLHATFTDNGKGLDNKAQSSIGLISLGNRARLLKGTIHFGANQPKGLKVDISIPKESLT